MTKVRQKKTNTLVVWLTEKGTHVIVFTYLFSGRGLVTLSLWSVESVAGLFFYFVRFSKAFRKVSGLVKLLSSAYLFSLLSNSSLILTVNFTVFEFTPLGRPTFLGVSVIEFITPFMSTRIIIFMSSIIVNP